MNQGKLMLGWWGGGGLVGGQLLPRRSKEEMWGCFRLGCDQNSLSCLEYLKCQSSHISFEVNTWSQNGWFQQEFKSRVGLWGEYEIGKAVVGGRDGGKSVK